jgi:hypothetical protein
MNLLNLLLVLVLSISVTPSEALSSYTLTQITFSNNSCIAPVINDAGEIIYEEGNIGIISTTKGFIAYPPGLNWPCDANNDGEIVWSAPVNGINQIFSNIRGQLTFSDNNCFDPVINNLGEVVYLEGNVGIVSLTRGFIACPNTWTTININDQGEIVWSNDVNGRNQIFSNVRGQLTFQTNSNQGAPSITDSGEVFYLRSTGIDGTPCAVMSTLYGTIYQVDSANDTLGFTLDCNNLRSLVLAMPVDVNVVDQQVHLLEPGPIPVPSTLLLLGSGLLGLTGWRRFRKG